MKTELSISIPALSLTALMFGACGMPDELSVTPALQQHPSIGERHSLSSLASTARPHCVASTTSATLENADTPMQAEPAPVTCFATFRDAIYFATQGATQLPADVTPDKLTNEQLAGPQLLSYVIGVEYRDRGHSGASLTFTGDSGCASGAREVRSISSGWDNEISSARAFSGCNHSYHYQYTGFGGARIDCHTSCSDIGDAMNDRTSSIKWTR